jgi:5'-3' exonuclease
MDANSIIYDIIHETDLTNIDEIYKNVYNKILSIIEKIKPNTTFIAFDGVVPLAKMKQQKQRRYKSYITKQILKNNKWNTNAITPGTKFMNELDDYLSSIFKDNKNIIFTGSKQSGEGEQKIFEYIRNNAIFGNSIIYGLDADLIMLSLLHLKYNENIYLYRETRHFSYIKGIDPQIDYLFSMDEMGTQIHELLNTTNKQKSIEDYCFLCFLCGNDFLPHFPSINIRNNGVQYLIETYKVLTSTLTIDKKINWSSFHMLCSEIASKEVEIRDLKLELKVIEQKSKTEIKNL